MGEVEGAAVGWFELWCLAVVGAYVGWALQQIDADALSPREALDLIYQLKQIQARSDAD